MGDLLPYFLRIMPGLIIIAAVFLLLPKKQILARIFLLILGFILLRDTMTPVGFWNFGITDLALWIRFTDNGLVLIVMGVMSLLAGILLLRIGSLRTLVRWGEVRKVSTYVVGLVAGLLVALPFLMLAQSVDISLRGGTVAITMLVPLLFMALAGNFLEELIFRGFFQSYLQKSMSSIRAALVSGLTFAAAHVFLASTVTDLGWPLLVFVAIEGLVCAFVYRRYGLISASITHGVAIFVLASGVV